MISITREQLEQARRVCERQAAPGARLWRVVHLPPPLTFDEPAEITEAISQILEFERVGRQWILRGSVRIMRDFTEQAHIRSINLAHRYAWRRHEPDPIRAREQWPQSPRPHVVIYREA